MTLSNKTTIKTYFQTGDFPSQSNFADFIDSCVFQVVSARATAQNIGGSITIAGSCAVSGDLSVGGALSFGALNVTTVSANAITANSISLTGTPTLSKIFTGSGSSSNFALNQACSAASATVAEIGAQFTMTSNVGSGNPSTAFKMGLTSSVTGNSGSASIYGMNTIINANSSFGSLTVGHEIDMNWDVGADAGALGSSTAAYSLVLAGASSDSHKATSAIWVTGTGAHAANSWAAGLTFSAGVTNATIIDSGDATTSYSIQGSHNTGLDMTLATISGSSISLANNQQITMKDSSGTLRNLINCNSGNYVTVGGGSEAFQFGGSSMFIANGSVATSLGSVGPVGSHTTVQEWLSFADSSGTQRYVPCF